MHISGKANGVAINILQLKVMKLVLGKLLRPLSVSHDSWVNLSIATGFTGWLTSGIFLTLPVDLKCLFFPYWGVMEMCVCPCVLLVRSEGQKFRESPPIKILQELWKNRKPHCRLETYSQKCPEQQWKASISHLGCCPNSLSFSPGFLVFSSSSLLQDPSSFILAVGGSKR